VIQCGRDLRPIKLEDALRVRPGTLTVTMSAGQWDALLAAAYEAGATLLEVDDHEQPIRAYRRAGVQGREGRK
jgi:hypothetical protein